MLFPKPKTTLVTSARMLSVKYIIIPTRRGDTGDSKYLASKPNPVLCQMIFKFQA